MSAQEQEIPRALIDILQSSQQVAVLTGAGISAESGVPTFRQAQTGLWAQYDPTELATPAAFERNPRLVWEWYTWRRNLISEADLNPAHHALVEMETYYSKFTLITQNVDGFHRLAGSRNLIELHGDIFRTKCVRENRIIPDWVVTDQLPPRCPQCDSLLRPDVVWFGESLPSEAINTAIQDVNSTQVFFSIGTSTLVEPAASLPFIALNNGATVVEINPQETPLTPLVSYALTYPAGEILPSLMAAIKNLLWAENEISVPD
jgi:NAD-dependent deacetylase